MDGSEDPSFLWLCSYILNRLKTKLYFFPLDSPSPSSFLFISSSSFLLPLPIINNFHFLNKNGKRKKKK